MSTNKRELWAQVAVPVPLRMLLSYVIPERLRSSAKVGSRAMVQVGPRRMTGIIVSIGPASDVPPAENMKPLSRIIDPEPLLDRELLTFVLRAADYYFYPPGEAFRAALPPGMSVAERDGRLKRSPAVPATVPHIRIADPLPGDPAVGLKRAPAQARLFARLPLDQTEIPVEELRRHHPRASQIIKALVRNGWAVLTEHTPKPDPFLTSPAETTEPPTLTLDQMRVLKSLSTAITANKYKGFLLHGVTGSGKTEVYLRAINRVLKQGKSALVIVPEIGLTPQLVGRFRARLGETVGVLHSGLTQQQRLREWSRIHAGKAKVAIGARSAVFAPVRNIGIIVVDEEHDPSFKQDTGFRYNGRDLALFRAQGAGAVAILGSATPSLETYANSEQGKLERLSLPHRVTPRPLPRVEVIDLRIHKTGPKGQSLVSIPLAEVLKHTIEHKNQAILFLNRRGYAPVSVCKACGEPVRCHLCSVAMTYHRRAGLLECHYCGYGREPDQNCPTCGAHGMTLLGSGTEKAEEMLQDLLGSEARVARLDSDVAPGRASEAVLARVRSGETNVLVGTQLVTKGHDLPGVTVVGVLLADASLHFPDFRATERTFQLLTQVAGRAGRGETEGIVVIQTFSPDHPVIQHASKHDYDSFYAFETRFRRELGYPPFSYLATIRLSSRDIEKVRLESERLALEASKLEPVRGGKVLVKGPAPAPIEMIRGRYRFQILFCSKSRPTLRKVLSAMLDPMAEVSKGVRAALDVDPVHML